MGYCMKQQGAKFFIPKDNFALALKTVKALHGKETINCGSSSHFSWVTFNFFDRQTLPDILSAWRWEVELDKEKNINHIRFFGEKYGDDDLLFQALAPYVQSGSYIVMHGEDGTIWRWYFENGKVKNQIARFVFEDN